MMHEMDIHRTYLLNRIGRPEDITQENITVYYEVLKKSGLDIVAITDHMKWSFGVALKKASSPVSEVLTGHWTDWIDYWSVDFESKREIISIKNEETDELEEHWTGDFIFENEWQYFRTKKERSLELKTSFHECVKGRYKVAVKVVDIFGNDTMKIIAVTVGGK